MLFKLFLILVLAAACVSAVDTVFSDDVLGLIVFKAGLQDPMGKLVTWNEDDETPCNWFGVKCNPKTNRVSELVLDGFSLSGHIGRGLLRLQFLQILSLANNNFTGTINSALSHLGNLQVIDLSDNNLSGPIPEQLFQQCGSIRVLSFARNSLIGNIPQSLTSCFSLELLNFSSNHLSGTLPSGLWYLRELQSLDFSDNLLEGQIPNGIQNLYDLRFVSLHKNRLSGKLPEDIGGCLLLKSLDFSENILSGGLPESMQMLSSCTYLNLRGNSLTGEVPHWIGELKNLDTLDLSANNFSGQLPSSIGNLQFLKKFNVSTNYLTRNLPESMANCNNLLSFDASHNHLTGNLPIWLFKAAIPSVPFSSYRLGENLSSPASFKGLQVLDLSSNILSGHIPSNVGELGNLQLLNISRNHLVGSIPRSIGELKSAYAIDFSDNQLNGSIPAEIGGAISLKELRLEKNFLTGEIPVKIGKCSFLTSLILSHNNLTGSIPAAIANLSNLVDVDLSFNKLSGSLPKELTNLSHLLSFNISHNHLEGELPVGGFFNAISPLSISHNPSLCGAVVNRSCPSVHPKPIVLNPNSSDANGNSPSHNHHHEIILSISSIIAIGAASFILLGVVAVTILNIRARSSQSRSAALVLSVREDFSCSPKTNPDYGKLVMFSGDAEFVVGAQALLNKDCELGRGGFGVVYKTVLRDGCLVAIKKLTVTSLIKSREDFESEVKKLGQIRHHNLVALEGYYWTTSLQLLIYEYVPNGSLYKHLHDRTGDDCLSWRQRFKIVLGMAKGLAYLHHNNIIHYNLKSTNVLIDSSGKPKVGDYGLAMLLPMLDRCILSSKIQSALGYMAPEFACKTVTITEKCDVYGFGILVLEVVTGKRPVEYMEDDVIVLCDMVRVALDEGTVERCVDERLQLNFRVEEAIPVMKLGLICASQVPSDRPDMNEVVNILELIQSPSEVDEELE
ncbi:putative LRR receptor-like serine/threonine-protein kinase IRK [Cucumis melo var. makuwa]|uniref:LRR receptor-like serine/threonine-protein kinase IRK n=1 Tax=Cucumis melo var. makuwa TaxID=1194695 RepID=A0A5A7TRM1_CUCMM|nr:putative LRR receptor-like serine/threonine-protein kinase IRK [Cucumis melo var. makuwa]